MKTSTAQGKVEQSSMLWGLEADVVVIGSGATGMPAGIRAPDAGTSVLVVETYYVIGGNGILNGGIAMQK